METKEKYERWLSSPNVSDSTKDELRKMSLEEIDDAFYQDIAFGTAGMRGLLGPGTNRINVFTVRKATIAFAQYLLNELRNLQKNPN